MKFKCQYILFYLGISFVFFSCSKLSISQKIRKKYNKTVLSIVNDTILIELNNEGSNISHQWKLLEEDNLIKYSMLYYDYEAVSFLLEDNKIIGGNEVFAGYFFPRCYKPGTELMTIIPPKLPQYQCFLQINQFANSERLNKVNIVSKELDKELTILSSEEDSTNMHYEIIIELRSSNESIFDTVPYTAFICSSTPKRK